ncbi:MAG: hypothetical protein AB2L07_08105 [Thermoanaerobaculaceae bacterium]
MAERADTPEVARVDERATMFARMARRQGTPQYEDTYTRWPELQAVDDRLRAMPPLCAPGGRHFDPELCAQADAHFAAIDHLEPDPRAVAAWAPRFVAAEDGSRAARELASALGAVATGACGVDPAFVYSHKGRLDEDYGRELGAPLPHALVFLVEMNHAEMQQAPLAPTIRESARQYFRAAVIARTLAAALREAGWQATPHFDAHYELILPPLAAAAGLGEVGRNNILVAHRFGSRVRIGAVSTDLPLAHDRPADLGVRRFCAVCRKCADNCPSGALSMGDPEGRAGGPRWPTRVEPCYAYWRTVGTDCGICMACCPFSHRDSWPHALVRWTVRHLPLLDRLLVLGDDLLYGRRWRPKAGRRARTTAESEP